MPDRIRTSWRCAQRRRRVIGRLAGAIGAMASSPAGAAEQPALALHELVLDAHRGIAQHEIAFLALTTGVVLFAVVTAIMLVRARGRAARVEAWARDQNARLREEIDRANALLLSEPQIVIDWPAGSDQPSIAGDPALIGLAGAQQLLGIASWLGAGKAAVMERAVEALRARGEPVSMTLTPLGGPPMAPQGRAGGGHAVLRLKEAGGIKRAHVELLT